MKQHYRRLFFFLLCLGFGTLAAQEATVIDNKGTLHTVTSNTVTTTAVSPTTPVDGDVWFDTTSNTTKIYEAATATWKTIDPDTVTVSATTPTLPIEGDVWFDTASNTTKIYTGSDWHSIEASSALSLWDNDRDTGIQVEETGDEDKIRFDTGGSERMLIDASGNVGIGTDLTSRTFTVSGTARITGLSVDTTATTSIVIVDETGELKSSERFWFNGGAVRSSVSTTNLLTSGMTATQSSDYTSGTTADLAINGNTSSSERALTAYQVYPWWKLDMGSKVTLNRLKLFQYSGAQVRLSNFYVVFSENDISLPATPTATDLSNLINASGNTAIHYSGQISNPSGDVNFEELTARYMIIVRDLSTAEHLQIAEVQAFKDGLTYNSITTPKEKVGIGTTLPGRTLTVSGTAQITGLSVDTTGTTSLVVVDSSGELKSGERFWFKGESSRTTTTTNILSSTMTATQSSNYGSATADRAINGNTSSGDRSLTQNQVYPWWKLDMGSNLTLNRLKLFQYVSSQFRLSNFHVVFSQNDINLPPTPTAADVNNLINASGNTAIHYSGQIPNQSGDVTFEELTARYMIIVRDISAADYLQIAEVQAFKDDITPTTAIRTLSDKVGIGTSAPSETLTVSGTAQITGLPTATGTASVVVADANGVLQKVAASSLSGTDSQTLTVTATLATATGSASETLEVALEGSSNASYTIDLSSLEEVVSGTTTPSAHSFTKNPTQGDLFVDTTSSTLWAYDGGGWNQVGGEDANAWSILGNSGTDSTTHFLGTTDAQALVVKTNDAPRLIVPSETTSSTRLLLANTGDFDNSLPESFGGSSSALLGIEGTNHSRLRLTAGSSDPRNDSQGASIDLHGNDATMNAGVLDLVSGSTASGTTAAIKFWTNNGTQQQTSAVVTGEGHLGIGTSTVTETLTVSGTAQITGLPAATGTTTLVVADEKGVLQSLATASLTLMNLWDTDQDTGIQVEETGDEDIIRFDTANAERMIIDENGNVGVGTSSPTNTLDVNGKARVRTLTDETSNDTISIVSVNDDGVLSKIERYWKQSDETRTQSSTNLFTSSMTATQPTTYLHYTAGSAINGNTSSGDRSITGQQVFPWWKLDMGSEITLNRLRFYQYSSARNRLSNFYVIFSKTDINLPTTPTQTDVDNLVNNNDSVQYSGEIPYQSGDIEFSDKEARYIIVVRNVSTADYLQMAEVQGFEDTLSYAGITTDKEKVGIGTSSPSEKLDVDGGTRIRTLNAGAAADEVVVADTNGVLKKRSLTDVVQEPWFGDDDDAAATTNTEDIYHMGQVGIGTTDPTQELDIDGDIRVRGLGTGAVQSDANGNFSVSSDERLKDIKGSFKKGLSQILGLKPINYYWNKTSGLDMKNQYTGFSAQNVQSVLPEAVNTDNRGYLTLSDRPILAASVNAIKELNAKNEVLEAENKKLKATLENVLERLDALEALQKE